MTCHLCQYAAAHLMHNRDGRIPPSSAPLSSCSYLSIAHAHLQAFLPHPCNYHSPALPRVSDLIKYPMLIKTPLPSYKSLDILIVPIPCLYRIRILKKLPCRILMYRGCAFLRVLIVKPAVLTPYIESHSR